MRLQRIELTIRCWVVGGDEVEEGYKNLVEILHVTYDGKEDAFYPRKVYHFSREQFAKFKSRIFSLRYYLAPYLKVK